MQPLHTNFMQQTKNVVFSGSSGRGNWQIGQSSSSDLVRPFFISTSSFPVPTHSSHLLLLCLRALCSLLYAASGSSRSHAPQILVDAKGIGSVYHRRDVRDSDVRVLILMSVF